MNIIIQNNGYCTDCGHLCPLSRCCVVICPHSKHFEDSFASSLIFFGTVYVFGDFRGQLKLIFWPLLSISHSLSIIHCTDWAHNVHSVLFEESQNVHYFPSLKRVLHHVIQW